MTNDEIIRMAKEAGLEQVVSIDPKNGGIITKSLPPELLERFAALVAANERERAWTEKDWDEAAEWIRQQEREACAKLALTAQSERMQLIREAIAAAIRARGKK